MYILIVGQSCAGKTTLANHLARKQGCEAYFEPMSSHFYPLFVEDRHAYAFKHQQEFMQLIYQNELKVAISSSPLIVQESGLIVCHKVYNAFLKNQSYISATEFDFLEEIYSHDSIKCRLPDRVIYIAAQVSTLERRALERDRLIIYNFEELLPYWVNLLATFQATNIPVLVLDTDTQTSQEDLYTDVIDMIDEWIKR